MFRKSSIALIMFLGTCLVASSLSAQLLNELEPNADGADPDPASIELSGTAGSAFDLWILSIEGDSTSSLGLVDRAANVMGTFDGSGLAETFHELVAAGHRAGEGAADADVVFAGRVLAKTGIEGDDFEDLDGLEFEFGCGPFDGCFVDVPEVVLQGVQDGKDGAAFAHGVMRDALVDFLFKCCGYVHVCPGQRSHSPMTKSRLPRIATTSLIM